MSAVAADACAPDLPDEVVLDDLGVRDLREVSERVYIVRHPALPIQVDAVAVLPTRRIARPQTTTAFIGRAGEVAHLVGRLTNSTGAGTVSMIIGEPGIGKTRLVSEVADAVAEHGQLVLWGRSPDGDWGAPYAPFVEALERHLAGIERDEARRLLVAIAEPLANVLPIVAELFPMMASLGTIDADERRFEILDALSRLLDGLAASQPVLLVLDDLHWVDHATAQALSFVISLCGRSKVHILGTYRDTEVDDRHPLTVALTSAQREIRIDRVRLRGLALDDGRAFIEAINGEATVDSTVMELVTGSGGNPFFLGELVRFRAENADATIPDSVHDAIRQRLVRLTTQIFLYGLFGLLRPF